MDILHSVILGVVEGVAEFLPISSTGHLILANQLLHIPEGVFTKSFDIIIQLGAILAVVVLYWKTLWRLDTVKKLIVGFIPTGVIGLALYKTVKAHLLGNEMVVLWMLLLGGAALIVFEKWYEKKQKVGGVPMPTQDSAAPVASETAIDSVSYKQAVCIGLFQSIAIIPGVSRSAATIVGGLLLGLKRATIVEFSFLLAVPTMLAATGLDLVKNYALFTHDQLATLSVGFVTAFVVALASIKFLLRYIQKHNFVPFGIYRIIVAVLFFLLFYL